MNTVWVVLRDASLPFDRRYRYRWPQTAPPAQAGMRVSLPFGKANHIREAFVWKVDDGESEPASDLHFEDLKSVTALLYPEPVLNGEQMRLAEMMRLRYACTYGEAIRCMLPPGFNLKLNLRDKEERSVELLDPSMALQLLEDGSLRSLGQVRVLELLLEYGESAVSEVCQACKVNNAVLRRLADKALLRFGQRRVAEVPEEESEGEAEAELEATPEQAAVLQRLGAVIRGGESGDDGARPRLKEFLLHGITGSGKTEVFLQLAAQVLADGRSCMILVPEIALTPQMSERFRRRFGSEVAVIHSRLTQRERFEQWSQIRRGRLRLLVGARSAVFMPLLRPALIIVDEEHEGSYQSEMSPRYHARTIARLRARDTGSVLLLASATPSIESYARTQNGRSELLCLNERPGGALLPSVHIVDMRREVDEGNATLFSRPLLAALERALAAGEQAMLFINRRGYSGIYLCRDCGYSPDCPSCAVALTHHRGFKGRPARLICHYCGHLEKPPPHCPHCGSARIQGYGVGTQQVEQALALLFPERRLLRMDQDTTYSRNAHKDILDAFRRGEADVLIGTQMIAKGHDIPSVTVVGILAGDQLINGSDFRAAERGFQLIVQASGRAGRGEARGEVYVQCFDAQNESLLAAASQDYLRFYRDNLRFREALRYPPFASLANIVVSSADPGAARLHAERLQLVLEEALAEGQGLRPVRLFPARPAYPEKLYGKFRFALFMRSDDEASLSYLLRLARQQRAATGVSLALSLDPA